MPIPLMAAGSSMSVIDREQIEARQSIFAVDLLRDVPGFAVSRSGSIGAQTQVRVRGAEANQLLVLIDGIEANDPAGNDEFAFQDLTTWDVERIEVVRGPQSALRGSDALAGVVNIITRQPTGEFGAEGFAETGAFDTAAAGARVAGAVGGIRTGLSVSRIDSNGSNSSRVGDEDDGYENTTSTLTLAGSPHTSSTLASSAATPAPASNSTASTSGPVLPTDTGDETAVDLGYFRAGGTLRCSTTAGHTRCGPRGRQPIPRTAATSACRRDGGRQVRRLLPEQLAVHAGAPGLARQCADAGRGSRTAGLQPARRRNRP